MTLSGGLLRRMRRGLLFRAIGAGLEADSVPTARGGSPWHASAVKAMCESQAAARLAEKEES
jgi:hypothetical protein